MDRIRIRGGRPLSGEIAIGGAKNAALPLMAAGLLTDQRLILTNVPRLADIQTMGALLAQHGIAVDPVGNDGRTLSLGGAITSTEAPYDIVRKMRASVLVLGPLLARIGEARVSMPGGCAIGTRPVDLHLKGLEQMGASFRLDAGYIDGSVTGRLRGATIVFLFVSVGAHIEGIGSDRLTIEGVARLHGAEHTIVPDRIETGTYACAAAITGGELRLANARLDHLGAVVRTLREAGVDIVEQRNVHAVIAGSEATKQSPARDRFGAALPAMTA